MSEDDSDRSEGVNFTEINPILEDISYPITAEEFVTTYGDREIPRTNAEPITIRELFEPLEEEEFESKDEVHQGILNLMPKESVGRQRYSDRGAIIDDPEEYSKREDRDHPGHGKEDE